jgi:hypothetical protein
MAPTISDPEDEVSRPIARVEFALAPASNPKKPESVTVALFKESQSEEFLYASTSPIQSIRENAEIRIRLKAVNRCSVSQTEMSRAYKSLYVGSFEKSFSDLSTATLDRADLSLEEIRNLIHEEAAKGSEVFEAFGMKFPAGRVTLWGELLLLSVQLYLFIYLGHLSARLRSDDSGWDVPWVGMDTSRLGQVILFSSLVVLPISAMALLDLQVIRDKHGLLFAGTSNVWVQRLECLGLAVALVGSICLGILSWLCRPKVEPQRPSCPSQRFE